MQAADEPRTNDFLTTIGQFPNVFSPDECRRLIELPVPSIDAMVDVRDMGDPQKGESNKIDYSSRRTKIRSIPPDPTNEWIFQRLRMLARQVNEKAFHFQIDDLMSVDVLEYGPDGFFDWHVDIGRGMFSTRKLTLVTGLTAPTDYEGGNLYFADGGAPLRLPLGTTAIFPSYLLHKVEPVTSGVRHTLVAWVHGPSFT